MVEIREYKDFQIYCIPGKFHCLIFPTNLHVYASTLPHPQIPLWWAFTVSKATCRVGERGSAEGKAKQDKMQENKIGG